MNQEIAQDYIKWLYTLRKDNSETRKADRDMTDRLKKYMKEEGLLAILNSEIGVSAVLQERNASDSIDVEALAASAPELLIELALAGGLKADMKIASTLEDAHLLSDFLKKGKTMHALIFEKEEKQNWFGK